MFGSQTKLRIRLLAFCTILLVTTNCWPQAAPAFVQPEHGFLTANRYVNAFFGFNLPFPDVKEKTLPFVPNAQKGTHAIFGLKTEGKRLTSLTITARYSGIYGKDAKQTASGPNSLPITEYVLGGRSVFKSESEEKTAAGKMRSVTYATFVRGYILKFQIDALDSGLSRKFERSIHSIKFFSPEESVQVAGPNAQPFPRELPAPPTSKRIGNLASGTVSGNRYVNTELGLLFAFPKGWHVVDAATQKKIADAGHALIWGDDTAARIEHERASLCSRTLLYVSDNPKQTSESRSAEIIMAFDTECLPDAPKFPASPQDTEAIHEIGAAILQALSATPFRPARKPLRVMVAQGRVMIAVDGEYAFQPEGQSLAERESASVMFLELNGYWVTITFSAHTESRVNELIKQAMIGFTTPR